MALFILISLLVMATLVAAVIVGVVVPGHRHSVRRGPEPAMVRIRSGASCRSCGARMSAPARYCGTCGTALG